MRGRGLVPALVGVALGWLAFCVLVWSYGPAPRSMAALLVSGTWGTTYGIGQVLFKATPLLFTGVAVDLALRAGLFNIGAEGQLAVASLVAGAVGAALPAGTPAVVAIPVVLLAAMTAGATWAAVPAWLRTRHGAHEVISTIMMNRIGDGVVSLALGSGLALAGSVRTRELASGARLPRLDAIVPAFEGSAVSLALVLGVITVVLVVLAMRRTRLGREIVLVGQGPRVMAAERVDVARRMALALVASGAIAGAASAATVMGYKGYFEEGLGSGAGFGGIAVAVLGRGSAVGILLAALLFGTLQQGGLVLNAHVPKELMDVLSGVIICAVALADVKLRPAAGAVR